MFAQSPTKKMHLMKTEHQWWKGVRTAIINEDSTENEIVLSLYMLMRSTELDWTMPDEKCPRNLKDIREYYNNLFQSCVLSTGSIISIVRDVKRLFLVQVAFS